MIIDFTVENYRSIKEPVTLSAVASPRRAPRAKAGLGAQSAARRNRIVPDEEIAQTYAVPEAAFEVLPVLGIFGANASGKSNVIRAVDDFFVLITFGGELQKDFISNFAPFLLDSEISQVKKFSARFLLGSSIYMYSLSLIQNQIIEEELKYIVDVSLSEGYSPIFKRVWSAISGSFNWEARGETNDLFSELQARLSSHIPFISFLVQNFDLPQISPLKQWLISRLPGTVSLDYIDQRDITVHIMKQNNEACIAIANFLRRFDTGLSSLEVAESNENSGKSFLLAVHKTPNGIIKWPFTQESRGTQNLLELANKVIHCLSSGALLIEDELGSNIHPNITREIIKLFQSKKTNPKHAQLIFTSHDNTLQRHNLLRRDQIWFTEKRTDGSTNLYPLTDFKPRNDLALDQAYLDGRFGAVPILPATEDLLPQSAAESPVSEPVG